MEKKERVIRSLKIEKDGDHYVSVVKKEFDFKDQGYFTESDQRMHILTKEFCKKNIDSIKDRIEKISINVGSNDVFLDKIETEFKKHWESKEFNQFMKNYEKKYAKLIKWKAKHDEFMTKSVQNEQFKAELVVEKEFDKHYEEMFKNWGK